MKLKHLCILIAVCAIITIGVTISGILDYKRYHKLEWRE